MDESCLTSYCNGSAPTVLHGHLKLKDGTNKREEEWFKTGILLKKQTFSDIKIGIKRFYCCTQLWGHQVFQKFVLDRFSCFLCLPVCLPG